MKRSLLSILVLMAAGSLPASSAIILLDLQGKGGTGLLSANENGTILGSPGSGGEVGGGITYDDVSNELTINVAWGSGNGFTNLSGNATMGHIHGPTPSSGTAAFLENVTVLFNLDDTAAWNNSASAGGINNRVITLTEVQEGQLLAGRYYINVHTGTNGGGEIRGNIVVVPEPASALLALGGLGLCLRRRVRGS